MGFSVTLFQKTVLYVWEGNERSVSKVESFTPVGEVWTRPGAGVSYRPEPGPRTTPGEPGVVLRCTRTRVSVSTAPPGDRVFVYLTGSPEPWRTVHSDGTSVARNFEKGRPLKTFFLPVLRLTPFVPFGVLTFSSGSSRLSIDYGSLTIPRVPF